MNGAKASGNHRTGGHALHVPKASQVLAKVLMERIVRREIAAGDCLPPEPELMAQYDVSRPTLREAIRILETQGLITTTRGGRRGARVHYPTPSQAAEYAAFVLQLNGASLPDVMQFASFVTPSAARLIAEHDPRPDLSPIIAHYEDIAKAGADPRGALLALHSLEAGLCALSGNHALKFIAEMANAIVKIQIEQVPAGYREVNQASVAQWRAAYAEIGKALRSIEQGKGQEAERILHRSLGEALELYRMFLAEQPVSAFAAR